MTSSLLPVDRGVPLPAPMPRGRRAPNMRPWLALEIGDSFLVPGGKLGAERIGASMAGERYARRFTVREVPGGVRVWRVG